MLLVNLIEQMFSICANPKFAGAQIVKHCTQLDSIGDSASFYSALQLGALLFLSDLQTYFPPSALSTTPATALAAFLSESILRCDCRKSPHRGGQCQEGSKCNHHCPRMGQKLAWIKIADKK